MTATFIKSLGLNAFSISSGPHAVDVHNGRIIRIRPLHLDSQYTPEQIAPWKVERNGKTFQPLLKSLPAPFQLAYKNRVYSPTGLNIP